MSIGVSKIDGQHAKLIEMVQRLEQALDQGDAVRESGGTLKLLVEYTQYHFKDEEDLMAQIGYPEKDQHKKLHAALIEEVRGILIGLRGENAITAPGLIAFLKRWVLEHIEKEDLKIGAALKRLRPRTAEADKLKAHDPKAPTQAVKETLQTLKSLFARQLIRSEDYEAKKRQVLEKLTKKFDPRSFVELTEEFEEFGSLRQSGLISEEDEKHFWQLMSAQADLGRILAQADSVEAGFEKLNALLERGILTAAAYDKCKAELLKTV
jgi:hemerythrin-like metal-binding protein